MTKHNLLKERASAVVAQLEADEAAGYRSNLRTYVLEMLRPALQEGSLTDPTQDKVGQ